MYRQNENGNYQGTPAPQSPDLSHFSAPLAITECSRLLVPRSIAYVDSFREQLNCVATLSLQHSLVIISACLCWCSVQIQPQQREFVLPRSTILTHVECYKKISTHFCGNASLLGTTSRSNWLTGIGAEYRCLIKAQNPACSWQLIVLSEARMQTLHVLFLIQCED